MQHPVGFRYQPGHRPRRADRLRRRADQQHRDLAPFPHAVAGALPDRGRVRRRRRRVADGWSRKRADERRGRATHVPAARRSLGCLVALVAGVGAGRHRRHPGQDHDRAAADEDGRRRGAVRHRNRPAPSRSSPSARTTTATASPTSSRSRTCCRSSPPATSTASRSRASTTCSSSTEEKYGPGDYRPEPVRHLLGFRAMIGFWLVPALIALLALWLTRARPDPRPALVRLVRVWSPCPTPFLANSRRLDLHRDGPPAVGGGPNPTGDQLVRLTVQHGVSDHAAARC